MDKQIVIDTKILEVAKNKAGELVLTKDAEAELNKILEAKDLIDNILEYVKEKLGEEMEKRSLVKIKTGSLTVSKRFFGTRYQLGMDAPEEFKYSVVYDKPNIEAIDKYIEVKKELPKGVNLRTREEKVSIVRKEE